MANSSDAYGWYTFDFSNTKIANDPQAQKAWLIDLHNKIHLHESNTTFSYLFNKQPEQMPLDDYLQKANNVVELDFFGTGRWCYQQNVGWFASDSDLSEQLSSLKGLTITIIYNDCESANDFVESGEFELISRNNKVYITHEITAQASYTPKNLIAFGFYDDINELYDAFNADSYGISEEDWEAALNLDNDDWEKWWSEQTK